MPEIRQRRPCCAAGLKPSIPTSPLARVLQDSLQSVGLPTACMQLIESTDRAAARRLMTLNESVDCLIPRGGASLIKTVIETATVPVIETGTGNCHVYVDKDADFRDGRRDRPERQGPAPLRLQQRRNAARASVMSLTAFLPLISPRLADADVEVRGDERTHAPFCLRRGRSHRTGLVRGVQRAHPRRQSRGQSWMPPWPTSTLMAHAIPRRS